MIKNFENFISEEVKYDEDIYDIPYEKFKQIYVKPVESGDEDENVNDIDSTIFNDFPSLVCDISKKENWKTLYSFIADFLHDLVDYDVTGDWKGFYNLYRVITKTLKEWE